MKKLYLNIYPLINVINQAGTNQMKARAINNRNILVLLSLVGGPSNKTKYLSPSFPAIIVMINTMNINRETQQHPHWSRIIGWSPLSFSSPGHTVTSSSSSSSSWSHHHHHHTFTLVSPFHGSLVRAVSVGWRWYCPADSFTVPAAAPRGTDPPIKQLKLTRWQFLQDPTTLLSINL